MSETVHYRGIATKIDIQKGDTVLDLACRILKERHKEIASYYENALECLCNNYDEEFFYHPKTNTLYKISHTQYEPDEEIIKAKLKDDGTIEYELRYYNGGAGFEECLEEAMDKL